MRGAPGHGGPRRARDGAPGPEVRTVPGLAVGPGTGVPRGDGGVPAVERPDIPDLGRGAGGDPGPWLRERHGPRHPVLVTVATPIPRTTSRPPRGSRSVSI